MFIINGSVNVSIINFNIVFILYPIYAVLFRYPFKVDEMSIAIGSIDLSVDLQEY